MTERKAVIKNADMSEEMQQDAVAVAGQALEKFNIEKDIAAYIKKEFDKKHSPTWHCIVGRNFGSYVTHETQHFIYFYLGQVAILLFNSPHTCSRPSSCAHMHEFTIPLFQIELDVTAGLFFVATMTRIGETYLATANHSNALLDLAGNSCLALDVRLNRAPEVGWRMTRDSSGAGCRGADAWMWAAHECRVYVRWSS
ncbi:Dynein light chain 1 cytoplasmic [Taenia crassiceps]|uniref:Dynein light chain 1 cytoplasmic n=1 Tax=Taenia crassiceps TaxID=6207 RepID=A0ABR4QLQ9_9CEST